MPQLMFSLYKNNFIYFADSLQNGLFPCKKVRTLSEHRARLYLISSNILKNSKRIISYSFNKYILIEKPHRSYYHVLFKIEIFSVYK